MNTSDAVPVKIITLKQVEMNLKNLLEYSGTVRKVSEDLVYDLRRGLVETFAEKIEPEEAVPTVPEGLDEDLKRLTVQLTQIKENLLKVKDILGYEQEREDTNSINSF